MMLVIGGMASGKKEWVQEVLHLDPIPCTPEQALFAPAVLNFQETVRALINGDTDLESYVCHLCHQNASAVILCDEVGMGVIPLTIEDRRWREAVGRACCLLQKECDTVVRVVCGLPMWLKGKP